MPAPDPVSLMRSRYSAYVLKLESYLLDTWHPGTRPEKIDFDDSAKWLGLEIRNYSNPSFVEFVTRFKINGRAHRLHETSQFVFEGGRWFYLDGKFPA
jgi:SEC-C motif-containing protein